MEETLIENSIASSILPSLAPSIDKSLNSKEELIQYIKEWIKADNDIKTLKTTVKQLVNAQKIRNEMLVNVMKNNNIDCFDINGGALQFKKRKTKKSISGKFLLQQMEAYFSDNLILAKEITNKVLDNRETTVKEEIKCKIHN